MEYCEGKPPLVGTPNKEEQETHVDDSNFGSHGDDVSGQEPGTIEI